MNTLKILSIICILYMAGCQTNTTVVNSSVVPSSASGALPPMPNNTYPDAAPQTCALTAAAQARLSASSCFSSLQDIIACMPPAEQDLWAYANAQNTNSTHCFDCSLVKNSIKGTYKQTVNQIGQKVASVASNSRKGLSCFVSFAKSSLTQNDLANITSSLTTVAANQKKSGQATAQILLNVGNVFIGRRRFLCLPNAQRVNLISSNDTSGKPKEFIYNFDEASNVVSSFVNYFQAKISSVSSMANEISSMTDVVANSPSCAAASARLRYLQTAPANSTSSPSNSTAAPVTPTNTNSSSVSPAVINPSSATPSANGPAASKAKKGAKTLGSDVTDAVTTVSTAIGNLKSTGAVNFSSRLQTSFSASSTMNCQPLGLRNFVSNVNLTGAAKAMVNGLANPNTKCTEDNIYIINSGSITCEGSCGSFTTLTLSNFISLTKVPANYYFASGCVSGQRFMYGTWSDLTMPTTMYTSFIYKTVNTDKRCLDKAAGCVPGGANKGGNASDGACATSSMAEKCSTDLNQKCAKSGLASSAVTPPQALPYPCDALSQGVEETSQAFITTCFTWIARTFFKKSITFDPNQIASDDVLSYAPMGRLLQDTSATPTIVATSQDTSATDSTFQGQTLSSSDVQVDGSTPTTVGSATEAVNQINDATSTLSAQYLRMGLSVLAMFLMAL